MSDCTKVKGYIKRYLRDELDKKKRMYVEGHVKDCIMCCAEMEFARKKFSVTELLENLQPPPSFFRRAANAPNKIKQRFKKAFLKRPVVLPASLVILLLFIPFGIYANKNSFFRQTEEIKQTAQIAQEIKKPAAPQEIQQKSSSVNPTQLKQERKDEKSEIKKQEIKKKEAKKEQKAISTPIETAKTEIKAEKKADVVIAKTETTTAVKKEEPKSRPFLFRLTLKSDLQPDIIFSKIESLSENSSAVILSTKGFMPDSSEKKEVLVRIPEEKYEGFLSEMKNQFNDVSSKIDMNIKLSNDISKQEGQAFVLIEIN
ncbi:MAG: hypothetical protein HZC10_00940 [Nitrospirae bacterium]|nr:hypothetical protein [Nitrospirota bacterium]